SETVRAGTWTFVEVELRYRGDAPLDAELRVEQRDRDGDIVTFVTPVALAPTGEARAYPVYFVPQALRTNDRIEVSLFDHAGKLVKMLDDTGQERSELDSSPLTVLTGIPTDEYLVVDLASPRKSPHAAWIASERLQFPEGARNRRIVRAMAP